MHLSGGVLLGRAYRGCNGEARWVEEFESYLNYIYSWIKIGRASADLGVIKLVDFVIRIPDQLSLHFYNFSVICYAFLKFTSKL